MSKNDVNDKEINPECDDARAGEYNRNDYVVCPVCGKPNLRPVAICKYCSNYMM
ncbi:MAG: hypothetical protein K2I79_01540 [Clostridia bacterium]|nr:hypothetical protein [Clostridia bacterium]